MTLNPVHDAKRKAIVTIGDKVLIPLTVATGAGIAANQFPQNRRKSKVADKLNKEKSRLSKMAPKIESDNPDFNYKAANAAYSMIMKMDFESAQVFADYVVSEMLEQDIEKNLRTLQRAVDDTVKRQIEGFKKAIAKTAISKGASAALPYAQAISKVEEIIKNGYTHHNPYDYGYVFREEQHPRGENGQFKTVVRHTQTSPLHEETAHSLGISVKNHKYRSLSNDTHRAQYQDEYRQLQNFLRAVTNSVGNPGDANVFLTWRDANTGETYTTKHTGVPNTANALDPRNRILLSAEAFPTSLTLGGAAFGLHSALGGDAAPYGAWGINSLNNLDGNFNTFQENWNKAGDTKNSNSRLYNRIGESSKFVGSMAPPGSKVQLAARMAQIVGDHGAEAEKVFGPTARKTAYRYRGTERRPDEDLVREYTSAINNARSREDYEPERQRRIRAATTRALNARRAELAAEHNKANPNKPLDSNAIRLPEADANRIRNEVLARNPKPKAGDAPSFDEQEAGREELVQHFRDEMNVPDKRLYDLQLASGNTPPSEGVLLNAKGQIVAQAIGYGDDHYLPFNLKNLKSLKGGQYVRTRSVGGPTAEDIYTGLMAGARQLTVVSRSGTFTVTFKDDFRGGRRHNDKARRMTRRYEQLLDSVQSGQVSRGGIDARVKAEIRRQVNTKYAGESGKVRANKIRQMEQEYRENPELGPEDQAVLDYISTTQPTTRDGKDYVAQVRDELMRSKRLNFELDGDGYDAALRALSEQFPYYLTTHNVVKDEKEVTNIERDKGYVEPGRNRPTAAKAGWYGTVKDVDYKFSAAEADHQRGIYGDAPIHDKRPKKENGENGAKTEAEGGAPKDETPAQKAVREAMVKQNQLDAAKALYELAPRDPTSLQNFSWLSKNPQEFEEMMRQPEGVNNIENLVREIGNQKRQNKPVPQALLDAAEKWKTANIVDRKFVAGAWPPQPPAFPDEPALQPGATAAQQRQLVKQLNDRYGQTMEGGHLLSSMGPDQLRKEHDLLIRLASQKLSGIMKDPNSEDGADARRGFIEAQNQIGYPYHASATRVITMSPEEVNGMLQAIQKMRALPHEAKAGPAPAEAEEPKALPAGDDDTIDAEVVEDEPDTEDTELYRVTMRNLDSMVRRHTSTLIQKPASQWSDRERRVWDIMEEYKREPPTDSGAAAGMLDDLNDEARKAGM